MSRIESGNFRTGSPYWSPPYGEPVRVTIPAGEFSMGSRSDDTEAVEAEKPALRLYLPEFQMARTPTTNTQYLYYLEATGAKAPADWADGQPPKDKLHHPVVYVTWHDACAYCRWLSEVTGKAIALPSEAEWEKAARGDQDQRAYPWGDAFETLRCNTHELGLEDITPVGIFPAGASPYGCLDMAGNVWECTRSVWGKDFEKPRFTYPYTADDGREDVKAHDNVRHVLRGGTFRYIGRRYVRCASRYGDFPINSFWYLGFRVMVRPAL